MTLINHGMTSGLIQFAICKQLNADIHVTLWTVILAVLLGIYPDVRRFFQKDTLDWSAYNKLHELTLINLLIPYFGLHIIEDFYTHDENGKWKKWVYWVEGFSDTVFLIIILKIVL